MIILFRNTGIAFLLCMVLLVRPVWPYLDFIWNKKYIETQLCEKRSKPNSCRGKCYLKKQLQKASDSDSSPKESSKSKKNILPEEIVWHNTLEDQCLASDFNQKYANTANSNLYKFLFHNRLYTPPEFS